MRRIIDLTVQQDRSIESLIRDSKYEDYQHFLSAAIDNQLTLELRDSGALLPSDHNGDSPDPLVVSRDEQSIQLRDIETVAPLSASDLNDGGTPNA